ncbi:MAG: hypothetical protein AAGA48_07295 [Myxococcota bacterium]
MRWMEELKKQGKTLVDALRSLLLPNAEPEPELAPVRVPSRRQPRQK